MHYYSGALFGILLSELGLPFYHSVGSTEAPLFVIASEGIPAEKPLINFGEASMSEVINQYASDKKRRFDEFLSLPYEEVTVDAFICGYDPMNMIKMNDMILCSHFIMLQSYDSDESESIHGPVMIHLKSVTTNEVQSYIKHC